MRPARGLAWPVLKRLAQGRGVASFATTRTDFELRKQEVLFGVRRTERKEEGKANTTVETVPYTAAGPRHPGRTVTCGGGLSAWPLISVGFFCLFDVENLSKQ